MIPANAPVRNAARRPNFLAIHPTGKVPAAIPTTKIEIGNVARPLSGARTEPTIAAVAKITVAFAPASAVAVASSTALRRAKRSSKEEDSEIGLETVEDTTSTFKQIKRIHFAQK
jgi:hypothetical protein